MIEPVDGGWGEWAPWSECTVECDGGSMTRSRLCNDPAPVDGGDDCEGDADETADCNIFSCGLGSPIYDRVLRTNSLALDVI